MRQCAKCAGARASCVSLRRLRQVRYSGRVAVCLVVELVRQRSAGCTRTGAFGAPAHSARSESLDPDVLNLLLPLTQRDLDRPWNELLEERGNEEDLILNVVQRDQQIVAGRQAGDGELAVAAGADRRTEAS